MAFKPTTYKEALAKLKAKQDKAKTTPKKAKIKRSKVKKPKLKSVSQLKKILWKLVSNFIRERDKFTCISCGRTGSGGQIHAGHFLPSGNCGALLRYHPKNIHAQCYFCNINLGGNGAIYYTKMVEKYGQDYVNRLIEIKNQTTISADREFYAILTEYYKEKNQEEIVKFLEGFL